jgi:hypothetical protein
MADLTTVHPDAVTLVSRETQAFTAAAEVTWTISPGLGSIDKQKGLYKAPWPILISRSISVIAMQGEKEYGRATVYLSAALLWMKCVGAFWILLFPLLILGVLCSWPPPAQPPRIEVFPSVVTLAGSKTVQFGTKIFGLQDQGVTWSATAGSITPTGLFTAPAQPAAAKPAATGATPAPTTPAAPPPAPQHVTVTATRNADHAQAAIALVIVLESELSLKPPMVEIRAGKLANFQAIGLAATETVNWSLLGEGSLKDGTYTAPGKIAKSSVAVVTATDNNNSSRQASATVFLIPGDQPGWGADGDPRARDLTLLKLVLIMGALGAALGALRSFAAFIGNRTFKPSWGFYYLSRPIFGAGLALLVFFGYRIGAVAGFKDALPADPSAAAFTAGLVGLFADTVLGKLKELIDTLFPLKEAHTDKMSSAAAAPAAVIDSAVGSLANGFTVTGSNFVSGSTVLVDEKIRTTTFVSATKLTAVLDPTHDTKGTTVKVSVRNPDGTASVKKDVMIGD